MTDEILNQRKVEELAALAARLPREIEPPADAWASIVAQIAAPAATSGNAASMAPAAAASGHVAPAAFWQRPAFLAAAALLLVAASSLTTWSIIGDRQTAIPPVASTSGTSSSSTPATLAEFTVRENEYIAVANRLSATLESDQVNLSDQTIAKLKESIRVIDAAILEARRALAEEPSNPELIRMLSTSYDQKIDLLERTTEMGRS